MKKLVFFLLAFLVLGETKEELLLRIRLLEREIATLEKKSHSLSARLQKISAEINLIQARLSLEKKKLREIEGEIKKRQENIKTLRAKMEELKKQAVSLALFLYKRGWFRENLMLELLSFRDPTYLIYLYRKVSGIYGKYKSLLREKTLQEKALKRALQEKRRLLRSLSRRRRRLSRKRILLQEELDRVLKDRKKKKKLLEELKSPDLPELPAQEPAPSVKPGQMIWPLRGKVVRRFGYIIHPVFHTKVKSNGIEIKPYSPQEQVRAAGDGRVEYVSRFSGYGRVVIIAHGGRIYTVYGHLLEVFVKKGQRVKAGQVIGNLGEGAFWKGRTLYFEVRKGGEPVNPLRWLKKR